MNNDAREEVRSRLAIEDIVGEYVQLKRSGRNWKGLSPFTGEKTASFYVSPDKNIWHDFSSNQGGDIFTFIMMVEGLDFRGALEILARKAGVDLSMYDTGSSKELSEKKRRLLTINESAVVFLVEFAGDVVRGVEEHGFGGGELRHAGKDQGKRQGDFADNNHRGRMDQRCCP